MTNRIFPSIGLLACSVLLLGAESDHTTFFLRATEHGQPLSRAEWIRTLGIMKSRLSTAHVSASVSESGLGILRVTIDSTISERTITALLTAPGKVWFKILPHGEVYEGPKGTAIRVATVTFYSNTPTVFCLIYNPTHFKRYTEVNIHHMIGLVIDNKVVYSATLMTAISNAMAFYGPDVTTAGANFLVAIINSGPLPDGVQLSKL